MDIIILKQVYKIISYFEAPYTLYGTVREIITEWFKIF